MRDDADGRLWTFELAYRWHVPSEEGHAAVSAHSLWCQWRSRDGARKDRFDGNEG